LPLLAGLHVNPLGDVAMETGATRTNTALHSRSRGEKSKLRLTPDRNRYWTRSGTPRIVRPGQSQYNRSCPTTVKSG